MFNRFALRPNNFVVLPADFNCSKLHSRRMEARLDSERRSDSANWMISVRRFPRIRRVTFIFHSPTSAFVSFAVHVNLYFVARFNIGNVEMP